MAGALVPMRSRNRGGWPNATLRCSKLLPNGATAPSSRQNGPHTNEPSHITAVCHWYPGTPTCWTGRTIGRHCRRAASKVHSDCVPAEPLATGVVSCLVSSSLSSRGGARGASHAARASACTRPDPTAPCLHNFAISSALSARLRMSTSSEVPTSGNGFVPGAPPNNKRCRAGRKSR